MLYEDKKAKMVLNCSPEFKGVFFSKLYLLKKFKLNQQEL